MKIGILGGGQLGLMLAEAATKLGDTCIFWDPDPKACINGRFTHICAPFNDTTARDRFLNDIEVITWESENISIDILHNLEQTKPVFPSINLLKISQDRLLEKKYFRSLGIEVANFIPISTPEELTNVPTVLGKSFIIKTRHHGYDGKGQLRVTDKTNLEEANPILSTPCIAEALVKFDYEVSIIAARDTVGTIVFYDLIQNEHQNGILHQSQVVKKHPLTKQAQDIATKVLNDHAYVGVLCIEFFVKSDQLIVNECAPRVHNSGHWSIEGAKTSQFENHIRCITGRPCASTQTLGTPIMTNVIGESMPEWAEKNPQITCHWYGKDIRPGRKCGHFTQINA